MKCCHKHAEKNELGNYERYLRSQEKSDNTVRKYLRDVRGFLVFLNGEEISREQVILYKEHLLKSYKISSANSMLTALNGYLRYMDMKACYVSVYRMQRQLFRDVQKDLNRDEYQELVRTASRSKRKRLYCLLQTIGSTGIRVSELKYITVEALRSQIVTICSKGKARTILIPLSLKKVLEKYCEQEGIRSGCIFVTRSGRPVDRRNIWSEMKRLCKKTDIVNSKVYPHNLRHLFARCYYEKEHDLVRLADYLGHSSVETTRRLHDDRKYGRVSTAAGVGAGGRWTPVDVNRQRDKTDCVEYGRHNPYYVVEC